MHKYSLVKPVPIRAVDKKVEQNARVFQASYDEDDYSHDAAFVQALVIFLHEAYGYV